MTPAEEVRAAAEQLRPSSPAVAVHTVAVRITPAVAEAIAAWLDSWGVVDLREHASMEPDARHALAIARAINGGEQR